MTLRSSSFVVGSIALCLAACGGGGGNNDGGGSSSSGTDGGSNPTGESNSNPTSLDTQSASDGPDSSGGNPTGPETGGTTTANPDTGSSDDSATTGIPECPYTPVDGSPDLAVQVVATGFDRPVLALGHPEVPDRLYVVEQGGDVRILEPGENTAPKAAFLHVDVAGAGNNSIGDERGLLGFAFHPDFPADPRVYVSYTGADGGSSPPVTVSEFMLMAGDDSQVDPASERVVIQYDKPAPNHNGGMIGFGPDGYLYIGTGDGGIGDDAFDTGRNLGVILAKMLRIDVEPDGTDDMPVACVADCNDLGPFDYTIPADNPFVDDPNAAPEVYAWGFRNPWRWSWDVMTGDLWLADVGQGDYEEIDLVSIGNDYGWSDMEGTHCFNDPGCDEGADPNTQNADGITAPLLDYQHGGGRCSVTGGSVYRSCEVPEWSGIYTYGDYCSGELFSLTWDGSAVQGGDVALDFQGEVVTGNGWNAWGDVYITTVEGFPNGPIGDGIVYRLAPE